DFFLAQVYFSKSHFAAYLRPVLTHSASQPAQFSGGHNFKRSVPLEKNKKKIPKSSLRILESTLE
ncbi:MAG: hypothetical protein MR420_07665, partial [Spirochaetia bacterium]|nr:hypothetical protein [Spirochaetia bacterium]